MGLSPNEIKKRAVKFSHDWKEATDEKADAQSFWNDFFSVFGIERKRVITFEKRVEKLGGDRGYIDVFWPGNMIAEHKTRGKDLNSALIQAMDYTDNLEENEFPKYIVVSDFENLRIYDLIKKTDKTIKVEKLSENIELFGFISGHVKQTYEEDVPLNTKAAELMGKLHDTLKDNGYTGHDLELLLVRLLFCLFADDTGIFNEKDDFRFFIENKTKTDGSDIGTHLLELFEVLNTPEDKRQKNLDEDLAKFPYINGKLFDERISTPAFDTNGRKTLLTCCAFDWGQVSPAIFGAMFQSVMDKEKRREIGAHYTSEKNIIKIVKSLFLDELWEDFNKIKKDKKELRTLLEKIKNLKFLDPACGCGNFLIIAYREIRLLEIEIHKALINYKNMSRYLDISEFYKEFDGINVNAMFGIEIEEFPARIAEVALWLMDHIMNMRLSHEFGQYFKRIPLKTSPHIVVENALRLDWQTLVKQKDLNYILGNPPFIGHHYQSEEQKADMKAVLSDLPEAGVMDFVSAWFMKAAQFIQGTYIKVGLVSTNSITQGEQVGILWSVLLSKYKIKLHFAHKTFNWSNEARGKAHVHVVIIGFANYDTSDKFLFEYTDINANPHVFKAKNINPYLMDGPDVVITNRSEPICDVPHMLYGSKPTDGGFFIFTDTEKKNFLKTEPGADKYIKRFLGADDFINNEKRWCLWLVGANSAELKKLPEVLNRIEAVKKFRSESKAKSTRDFKYPTLFRQVTQPTNDYIFVPRVSSEKRKYIPMGFFDKNIIVADSAFSVQNANLYTFGFLTSEMHMVWVNYTCGRLESRYRYSKDIVYNNFSWPESPTKSQINSVSVHAEKVLEVRKKHSTNSLAELYDPLTMPPDLIKAHADLDKAVDLCYKKTPFSNDQERMDLLFKLYLKYTEPLMIKMKKGKKP